MKGSEASAEPFEIRKRIRCCLQGIVGRPFGGRYTNTAGATQSFLIIEEKLQVPLFVLILLNTETIAYAQITARIGIVLSRCVLKQLFLAREVHELPLRIGSTAIGMLEKLANDSATDFTLLEFEQSFEVILHHVSSLVPLTYDSNDWHLDRW